MTSVDQVGVTVIMATYGRGRSVLPSVLSVLRQDHPGFELIVVGDATTDETEAAVRGIADARLRWLNLTTRVGSQSGPNTAGIAAAKGGIIAYIGHDDIWEPDHLAALAAVFRADPGVDFGVSGAIYHLPNGIPGSLVTGLFAADDRSAPHRHFFPPSSFSHRRDVTARIGPWGLPDQVRAPVDADFLLRAASAGLRFASTGRITVHKFAAGHRYLSYLDQTADEQQAMLAMVGTPGQAARTAAIVDAARRLGTYMVAVHSDYSTLAPGELARQNAVRKGLLRPQAQPLGSGVWLRQEPSFCALDWADVPEAGIRWTARNPVPRFLLPVTGAGPAALSLFVHHADRTALGTLDLRCNGQAVPLLRHGLRWQGAAWRAKFRGIVTLRDAAPSVLEFHLHDRQAPQDGQRGIGLGEVGLVPAHGGAFAGTGRAAALSWAINRLRLRLKRREMSRAGKAGRVVP